MKAERRKHHDHTIELREREDRFELLIDDVPVRFGQLPGGLYYLHEYAYDWTDDLMELARRFIDYRRRAREVRTGTARKGK